MANCGIYSIRHLRTGKEYIGGSKNIRMRFQQHRSCARHHPEDGPLYALMAEEGFDAFEWRVIIFCVPEDLRNLERQFMLERRTIVPNGFNRGSENGAVSLAMRAAMDEGNRAFYESAVKAASSRGIMQMAQLLLDPDFAEAYGRAMSQGASKREANIRSRRAVDPAYDERIRQVRRRSMLARSGCNVEQSRKTFRERMKDPEYAERVRENRRRAALISAEKRRLKSAALP